MRRLRAVIAGAVLVLGLWWLGPGVYYIATNLVASR